MFPHRTWLIQRLQKPQPIRLNGIEVDNPFFFGGGLKNGGLSNEAMNLLRGIFRFDYMGASEFEWGAVPNALRNMAKQSSEGKLTTDLYEVAPGKVVFYVCHKDWKKDVEALLDKLYKGDDYKWLKESSHFKRSLDESSDVLGWLELDNGFAFFKDETMFGKFSKLMGIK